MWEIWLKEIFVWPARWLDAWMGAVASGSVLDVLVLAVVTLGAEFLSFVVDDEIGMRLIGETPFVKTGVKSFFLGLGPVMLFLTIPFALALPVSPETRLVALLAWPATVLWSLLIMPLYIISGEMWKRSYDAFDFTAGTADFIIVSVILAVIGAGIYRYTPLPEPWNTLVAGYLILSAVVNVPAWRMKAEESVETVHVELGR